MDIKIALLTMERNRYPVKIQQIKYSVFIMHFKKPIFDVINWIRAVYALTSQFIMRNLPNQIYTPKKLVTIVYSIRFKKNI